jgi:hypothetical protein
MLGNSGNGEELYAALHSTIVLPDQGEEQELRAKKKQPLKSRFKHRKP